jgi:hypothetical protein
VPCSIGCGVSACSPSFQFPVSVRNGQGHRSAKKPGASDSGTLVTASASGSSQVRAPDESRSGVVHTGQPLSARRLADMTAAVNPVLSAAVTAAHNGCLK